MTLLQTAFFISGTCFFTISTWCVFYGLTIQPILTRRNKRKEYAERDAKLKAMAAKEAEAYAKRKADQAPPGPANPIEGCAGKDVGPGGMATSDPPSRWDK